MPNNKARLSFKLFDLERNIAQRNFSDFEQQLISLFNFLDTQNSLEAKLITLENGELAYSHIGLLPLNNKMSLEEKQNIYSRLACIISTYLSDTQHIPSDEVLIHFIIGFSR